MLKTIINKIRDLDDERIKEAAQCIKNGGIIVYPTETVYGLGANAVNEQAVKKIFIAKGRSDNKPLTVIVGSKDISNYVVEVPKIAEELIEKFWPGPLTIILKKKDVIPDITSANLDSIGIRMTSNKLALKLIEYSNSILTATSANISGKQSHTNMDDCIRELYGKVDYIISDGKGNKGIESTIIDCTVIPPRVLRDGAITLEMLKEVDSNIEIL